MSRTRKYRVWDPEDRVFTYFAMSDIDARGGIKTPHGWVRVSELDEALVTEYTGLKDRNAKDIYEGDIVRVSGYQDPLSGETESDLCTVEYEGPSLMYVDVDRSYSNSVESIIGVCSQDEDAEVIGNVWQNHELLKS